MPLKPRWEAKVSTIKFKVYSLGNKARQLINETFDKMYYFGRLKFMSEHTSFRFPIFVVWKTDAKGKRKSRAVVNIPKLNKIIFSVFYPLSL